MTNPVAGAPPRVAFVNAYGGLYGAERSLLTLVQWLATRGGCNAVLLCPPGALERAAHQADIRVVRLSVMVRPLRPKLTLKSAFNLMLLARSNVAVWRAIQREAPDLIHANGASALVHLVLTRLLSRKTVLLHRRDKRLGLVMESALRWLYDRALTPEPPARPGPPRADERFVPNPLFSPVESQRLMQIEPPTSPIRCLAIVGQIAPRKRQLEALRALIPLLAHNPQLSIRMIGAPPDGDDSTYLQSVRRLCDRQLRGVDRCRVRYVGFVEEHTKLYSGVDAVILASRMEPFGRVALEAMSMGCLAIVSQTAGVARWLRHGWDSILFDPGDLDQLRREIAMLLERPQRAADLRREGHRTAVRYLARQGRIADYVAVTHRRLALPQEQ